MARDFGFKGFCDGSKELLDRTRFRLAAAQADGALGGLGLLNGLGAGGVIIVFRYGIEFIQSGLMPSLPLM